MSIALNLADLYDAVARVHPDRLSLICGEDRLSYAELNGRAAQFANHLREAGIGPDEHVGQYMLNRTEYVEALLGCFTARAVPVNINYRYTGAELAYLFRDAQFAALVVEREYVAGAAEAARHCPSLRHVIVCGGLPDEPVEWPDGVKVVEYADVVRSQPTERPELGRTGDDRFIIYTGGTTGFPKGVIWRHEDFFMSALAGGNHYGEPFASLDDLLAAAGAAGEFTSLLAAPLMHGAGTYTMFTMMFAGGTVLLTRRFDPAQILRLVGEEHVVSLSAVGDAMVRPLVDELQANPDAYDTSTLFLLGSGGALLSQAVRDDLARLLPNLIVINRFGASESGSDGALETLPDGRQRLAPLPHIAVLDESLRRVGPGGIGFVAKSGHVPLGYFNDPEKTARTFPVIDGVRWAVLGDVAEVAAEGSIIVLGRGSMCINTGGEKVFPEEVEAVLKSHPAVLDVLVAAAPDPRFGERVGAVVELRPGNGGLDVEELRKHCGEQLARYKVPGTIKLVPAVVRSPTGKADYRWAKSVLADA
jgi:acyl-CoA synthetase (AMP-forming)/AMP-acid ligase II